MRTSAYAVAVTAVALAVAAAGSTVEAVAEDGTEPPTTIVVDAAASTGPASTTLLGVNHRYNDNGYQLWRTGPDAPAPGAVEGAVRAGIQSVRFPGGTIGNSYDWKRAIGEDRGCQLDGRGSMTTGFRAVTRGLAYGPDEHMEFVESIGAQALIMVPFVMETAADAADWVEYMNTPAGPGNPNGGVDWAELRAANGHPEPYGVQRWEVGNEHHHLDSRHWLSPDTTVAAQEYAFGGSRSFVDEPLGKRCSHPVDGIPSDGSANQQYRVLYPPVDPASVVVKVGGRPWRQVTDLRSAGAKSPVYQLLPATGEIRFGDGVHGKIPSTGRQLTASYTSVHEGYFDFAAAMKAVDPSIKVCATFGRIAFVQAVEGHAFDCLTTHPITSLAEPGEKHATWQDALQGHDRIMLAADQRRRGISKLQRRLPTGTPLWFTEAAVLEGDPVSFPTWASSATQAAYMATNWGDWMELGIEWGMSSIFLWGGRGVLGPRPHFTFSAEATTRQAISPMFRGGGVRLPAVVLDNPVRSPEGAVRSYDGLAVTATKAADGAVHVMVVNRLPTDQVATRIRVDGHTTAEAEVRTVAGDHFTSSNRVGEPAGVVLRTTTVPVEAEGLVHTFPAASTTVIRLPAPPAG